MLWNSSAARKIAAPAPLWLLFPLSYALLLRERLPSWADVGFLLAAGTAGIAAAATAGVTPLARGGALVRILAPSAPAMQEGIQAAWAACRAWLWNLPPLLLRKI